MNHPAPIHAASAAEAATALASAYVARAQALDRAGFLDLYEPDVVVVDVGAGQSARNREEWARSVDSWFGSLDPGESNGVEIEDPEVTDLGDLALVVATPRYWMESGGQVRYSMHNRLTWLLRRGPDGAWRILHEHTSVPIVMETGKAQLQAGEW